MTKQAKNNQSEKDSLETTLDAEETLTLFVFYDNDTGYAVPPESVIQVTTMTNPTPLPFSPTWLDGVISIQGEILPVLNLAKYFQLGKEPKSHHQRHILLDWENNHFVVWSSRVIGLQRIKPNSLEAPLENLPRALAGKVEAHFRMGDQIIYLLNLTQLLKESKERVSL